MLDRLLVPLDASGDSEDVVPYVARLAGGLNAHVVLLTVVPDPHTLRPAPDERLAALLESRRTAAAAYLTGVQQRHFTGLVVTSLVEVGIPADRIVATAHAQQTNLIAMATHDRSGSARLLLGSVADRVVRSAHVPVLLVRPHEPSSTPAETPRHVLLPLDGTTLAETAIEYAVHLARTFSVPITVIRDIPLTWVMGSDPSGMAPTVSPDVLQDIEDEAQHYLDDVVSRLRAEGVTVYRRFGPLASPATDIITLASEIPGSIVVMTTHARGGVPRAVLGSVTSRVIHSSTTPVLVVPPGSSQ